MGKHLTNKDFDFYINQRMTDVYEARRAPLLIVENQDPDDLPSMSVYQSGDDLTTVPDDHEVPFIPWSEQFDRILPRNDERQQDRGRSPNVTMQSSNQPSKFTRRCENMTEKELVRRFGQWVARWDIGFFAIEGGRYYIGVPDNLLERFRLLARDNLELCLQLWRDFEAGYWDVMSRVEIDQEDDEEDEGAPFLLLV